MIASPNKPSQLPYARNAFWVALVIGAVVLVSIPFYGYLAFQSGAWQLYALTGGFVAFSLIEFGGAFTARRGHAGWSALLIFIGNLLAIAGMPILIAGVALLLAFVAAFLSIFITAQILPPAQRGWVVGVHLVVGFGVVLMDLFHLTPALRVPLLDAALPFIFIILFVIFAAIYLWQFRDYSLTTKFITAFLFTALIPVGLVTYLNINASRLSFTEAAQNTLLIGASQTAASLDNFFTVNLNAVRAESRLTLWSAYLLLSDAERTANPNTFDVVTTLSTLSRKGQSFSAAYTPIYALLDADGNVLQASALSEIGRNHSDADYFRTPFQTGQAFLSAIEFSGTPEEAAVYFSSPVKDTSGAILGVLLVRYNAAVLQQLVLQGASEAGEGTFVILLDENHVRLAHATAPELLYKSLVPLKATRITELQAAQRLPHLPAEELSTDLPDFEQGVANAATQPFFAAEVGESGESDDIPDLAAVTSLKTQPWFLVQAQLQSVALAPVDEQTRNAELLALVVFVVVTGIGYAFARLLSRPIQQLASVAERIAAGDVSARTPVTSTDEIGQLATSFNNMTEQLTAQQRDLSASMEVSRRIASILDPQALVLAVVEQLQSTFQFYHAHIYVVDLADESLVMAGGTGEVGRALLAKRHRIPRGRGLVGRAALTQADVIVPDTTQEPSWLPNALLPNTKSEIALPLIRGGRVLGVLDVQDDAVNRFTEKDATLLRSIADQIAVALENARQFEATRQQAERRALLAEIGQKIQSAATIDETLQVAVREMGRVIGSPTYIEVSPTRNTVTSTDRVA